MPYPQAEDTEWEKQARYGVTKRMRQHHSAEIANKCTPHALRPSESGRGLLFLKCSCNSEKCYNVYRQKSLTGEQQLQCPAHGQKSTHSKLVSLFYDCVADVEDITCLLYDWRDVPDVEFECQGGGETWVERVDGANMHFDVTVLREHHSVTTVARFELDSRGHFSESDTKRRCKADELKDRVMGELGKLFVRLHEQDMNLWASIIGAALNKPQNSGVWYSPGYEQYFDVQDIAQGTVKLLRP